MGNFFGCLEYIKPSSPIESFSTTLPYGSITPEIPVLEDLKTGKPVSTERNIAFEKCWLGPV